MRKGQCHSFRIEKKKTVHAPRRKELRETVLPSIGYCRTDYRNYLLPLDPMSRATVFLMHCSLWDSLDWVVLGSNPGWVGPSSSCLLILLCVNYDLYGSLHINSRLHARLNNQPSHPVPSSSLECMLLIYTIIIRSVVFYGLH